MNHDQGRARKPGLAGAQLSEIIPGEPLSALPGPAVFTPEGARARAQSHAFNRRKLALEKANFPTSHSPSKKVLKENSGRFEAIDLARGFAVALMILSHGVKGLLPFEKFESWGLVPIHLITKFSSSLFILVFGMSLALAFIPYVDTPQWPAKRKKLWVRGLVVLFWYKVLTILELSHLYGRDEIWSALTYQSFPVYVEILGFYSIALLWIPLALPAWKKAEAWVKFSLPVLLLFLSTLLYEKFDFFGSVILKAMLVEHPDHYAWGQLSRAPLIFVGLLLGWMIQSSAKTKWPRLLPGGVLAGVSLLLFGAYLSTAGTDVYQSLVHIAMNAGKHPPEAEFMFFSLGGAFLLLAISVLGGKPLTKLLAPLTFIGKHSLQAFVFHIVVLFVFYRFLFDYFHKIEYSFALTLGALLIVMTCVWLKLVHWVRANQ